MYDLLKVTRLANALWPLTRVKSVQMLAGGVSAQVAKVTLCHPDDEESRVVLRTHSALDHASNPDIAAAEFKLLQLLAAHNLPVPTPLYLAAAGEIAERPSIVMAYVEGQPDFTSGDLDDRLRQSARFLARLHQLTLMPEAMTLLPNCDMARVENALSAMSKDVDARRMQQILRSHWSARLCESPALLHGDFWPGNVLWQNGKLVGVIDWEDAAMGDPVVDVANSSVEMVMAFGVAAQQTFIQHYAHLNSIDLSQLPQWQYFFVLRILDQMHTWGLAVQDEATKRQRLVSFARHLESSGGILPNSPAQNDTDEDDWK